MIEIGKVNTLTVSKETKSGYYLKDGDSFGEVFLPPAMTESPLSIGDEIQVFVYIDNKDKLIATTEKPFAEVGEYALLNVVEITDFGAFFDWGIAKDLLVPANEQKFKVGEDEEHLVRICKEVGTDRIFGTTKFGSYLENIEFDIAENDKVTLVPVEHSELGFRVIINKKYLGLIYENEIFTKIEIGKELEGYVKKIREDGFVDAALQVQGIKNLDNSKRTILAHLFKHGGKSHLHDKSSPEEIQKLLGMSKKTFKNSLGMLYKDRMVKINEDGIELLHKKPQTKG